MRFLRRRKAGEGESRPLPALFTPRPSHADAQEQAWRAGVAEHGWMVIGVPDDGEHPGFHFTTGLTERELPELIVYGLPDEVGTALLNDLAQRLVDGARYADGEVVPDLVDGDYRMQLWDVTWLQDPLGAAFQLYGRQAVRVRQLVVPDRQDRLPWEDDYALAHLQPVLFEPPGGGGPRRAGPEEESDHAAPADWDLPQDPHLGVVVTGPVGGGELPVLLAVQYEVDDWQFVDGVTEPDEETAQVLCLHHVVGRDPTLREVLRILPERYEAHRDAAGAAWQYRPTSGTDEGGA